MPDGLAATEAPATTSSSSRSPRFGSPSKVQRPDLGPSFGQTRRPQKQLHAFPNSSARPVLSAPDGDSVAAASGRDAHCRAGPRARRRPPGPLRRHRGARGARRPLRRGRAPGRARRNLRLGGCFPGRRPPASCRRRHCQQLTSSLPPPRRPPPPRSPPRPRPTSCASSAPRAPASRHTRVWSSRRKHASGPATAAACAASKAALPVATFPGSSSTRGLQRLRHVSAERSSRAAAERTASSARRRSARAWIASGQASSARRRTGRSRTASKLASGSSDSAVSGRSGAWLSCPMHAHSSSLACSRHPKASRTVASIAESDLRRGATKSKPVNLRR